MKHYQLCVSVAAALACLLSASSAFAVDYTSPWGSSIAVEARVGGQLLEPQWIIWKRKDTGQCVAVQIGDINGLWQDTNVVGTNMNDTIIVQFAIEQHCGKWIGNVQNNGHTLDISGGDGHDLLLGSITTSGVYGGNGNDIVASNTPGALLSGGLGNDDLESWEVFNGQEKYYGDLAQAGPQDGNDCIYDRSRTADFVACANGQDKVVAPISASLSSCENPAATCCAWAHLMGAC